MTTRVVEQGKYCNRCRVRGLLADPIGYYDWFGWNHPLYLHVYCAKAVKDKLWKLLDLTEAIQ